jgi:hypothetical protein
MMLTKKPNLSLKNQCGRTPIDVTQSKLVIALFANFLRTRPASPDPDPDPDPDAAEQQPSHREQLATERAHGPALFSKMPLPGKQKDTLMTRLLARKQANVSEKVSDVESRQARERSKRSWYGLCEDCAAE